MIRLVLAFAAGVVLYQAVVVVVGGILAAIAVPPAYYSWFGRQNIGIAHAVDQFVGFALPVAVLVAGGTLAVHRVLSAGGTPVLYAVLFGLIACFAHWLAASALHVPPGIPAELLFPPSVRLRQILLPPWWAVSSFVAPWVGFALAAWLVRRKREA